MSRYAGCKSLDAEIGLNLITGIVNIDYSLNERSNIFESNIAIRSDNNELKKASFFEKISFTIKDWFFSIIWIPFLIYTIIFTIEERFGIVGATAQYEYQKSLKWFYSNLYGISEQSKIGELYNNNITFNIPHNIWFEYSLSEEYSDYIKSISLKRNYIKFLRSGKYSCLKQNGWNVIFEFTQSPKKGECKIRYV